MPIDPRMVAAPSSPSAPPASTAALNNLYMGLLDLSRRVDRIDAARTVVDPRSLDGTNLKLGAISASEIEVGNIVASIMTVGAVNASHIDAASIRSSVLDAAVLTAGNAYITSLRASILDAGILTATNATIGTLRASIINGTQIVAQNLQAQVLTAVNAAITNLSSFNVSTGTLTADLLRTAASGARVEVGATAGGIKGYNSGGTMTFGFDTTTGAATVGAITVTGAAGTSVPASTLTGFVGGGNLLRDSSFESTDPALQSQGVSTAGTLWNTNAGASWAKATTQVFHGTTALAVTATGTSSNNAVPYAADQTLFLSSLKGRPLVWSAWVYIPSATPSTLVAGAVDNIISFTDGLTFPAGGAASTIPRDTWTRVVQKVTPSASATAIRPRLHNPFTSGVVYFDGVQLELGDAATAYNPKADEIVYGKITTVELAVGAVQASNIGAGQVTATKLSATAIDAMTITLAAGGKVQTASSGARVTLDAAGLRFNDGVADTVSLSSGSNGLALLASTNDSPPASRKLSYLHASGGATAGEFYVYSNASATPSFTNSSFTTDLSSWTLLPGGGTGGSVTRDTTVFDSSPASMKLVGGTSSSPNSTGTAIMTGTFKTGLTYRVPFSYRTTASNTFVAISDLSNLYASRLLPSTGSSFSRTYIEWTPVFDVTDPTFTFDSGQTPSTTAYLDTVGPVELMTRTVISSSYKSGGIDTAGVVALVTGSAGTRTTMVINDAGQSNFLQLPSVAKRVVNFGTATVTWTATGNTAALTGVVHGLSVTPSVIVVNGTGGVGATGFLGVFSANTFTSSTFTITAQLASGGSAPSGSSVPVQWIAIG